jgi:hypothetical protein
MLVAELPIRYQNKRLLDDTLDPENPMGRFVRTHA